MKGNRTEKSILLGIGCGGRQSIKEIPGEAYFELSLKGRMNKNSIINNIQKQEDILEKLRKQLSS